MRRVLFSLRYIEPLFLCPLDDGKGYPLLVFVLKLVLDVAVVVEDYRNIFIFNESFCDSELGHNVLLYSLAYPSACSFSFVFDGEAIRIFPVGLEKAEELSWGNL